MFALLKDTLAAAALKAKGDRLARERAVALMEGAGRPSAYSVHDMGDSPAGGAGWAEVGRGGSARSAPGRLSAAETRAAARELAAENPYARNALRVLESYVVGPGATLSHARRPLVAESDRVEPGDSDSPAGDRALRAAWGRFWEANAPHVTLGELAVRVWRDGEAFVRLFPRVAVNGANGVGAGDVPAARFLDPEEIGPTRERPDGLGVLTDPADAVTPVAYLRIDPATGEHAETIPAAQVLHVKAGADDAEVRGVSVLAPLIGPLTRHAEWLETELTARRVQASVVLWRRVKGGVGAYGDTDGAAGDLAGERAGRRVFAPGSILTTPDTTDLEFLAPKSSFAEASQLGRAMLLSAAAGVGLPEFMLTADASNANYASTMAAEGPAVKRFAAEQRFFAAALSRLWAMLARDAVARGAVTESAAAGLTPQFTFADLAHRDRPAERGADVQLVEAGVLSRAELARREGVDPQRMRRERSEERAD